MRSLCLVSRARAARVALFAGTALALAACKDGTGPQRGTGGIRFVAGADVTDTIDSRPIQALVVEVRDSSGRIAPGMVVRFRSTTRPVTFGENTWNVPTMLVAPLEAQSFMPIVADTTGASGRAAILVQLGGFAGTGGIEVTVPELGLVDTASFTIEVGAADSVRVSPADTLVTVGATAALRAVVTDRYGNPRNDAVTWSVADGSATVAAGGVATVTGIGRARLVATSGALASTAFVSGIVPGTLSAFRSRGDGMTLIQLFQTDGSRQRTIFETPSAALASYNWLPHWARSSARLVFQIENHNGSTLHATDSLGNMARFLAAGAPVSRQFWAQVSRDEAWVYFAGDGVNGGELSVWRARLDGTGAERLATGTPQYVTDTHPSPSPDGTRVAFASNRGGTYSFAVYVLDLRTGVVTPLGTPGFIPRWSPTGDQIAYLREGVLHVVRPDGSGDRIVGAANYPFDWSPDGEWIVTSGGTGIDLLRVATGQRFAVPGTLGMSSAAWLR